MQIVTYRPELAPAFSALNRAWIEQFFTLEAADRLVLDDPQGMIIDRGGQIWFAIEDGQAIGAAAAILVAPGRYELAKMAVAPSHQGHGLGQRLSEAVIAWVRAQQGTMLFLRSNASLAPAIRLYERLGFVHAPMPAGTEYARANVYMEMPLVGT
jgi:GNAT superfamily N-acetyltransferase